MVEAASVHLRHLFLTTGVLGALMFLTALLTCRISGGPF